MTTSNEYAHLGNDRRTVTIVCPWCGCEHKEFISPWEIFGWHVGRRVRWCESDECEACEKQFIYELGIVARTTRIEIVYPTAEDVAKEAAKSGVVIVEQDPQKPTKTKWQDA